VKTAWADPFLLHLIALFPALLLAAVLLWWRRRREVAEALGDPVLVRRLAGTDLRRFPGGRAALLLLIGALLGVAAAGPRWGNPDGGGARGNGDVVLVLDASNSMLVEDVAPSRLARERVLARALVDRLAGSRVGLIAFGGSGHALSPLTSDASAPQTARGREVALPTFGAHPNSPLSARRLRGVGPGGGASRGRSEMQAVASRHRP
jgi:Ca-activated chloride channel family protein